MGILSGLAIAQDLLWEFYRTPYPVVWSFTVHSVDYSLLTHSILFSRLISVDRFRVKGFYSHRLM